MWEFTLQVLSALGGFGLLVALTSWIASKVVTQWQAKELERYKTQLKEQSDRSLEELKIDLKRASFAFETRFGRVHDQLLKAMTETYPSLVEIHLSVGSYLAMMEWGGEPSEEEK